MKYAYHGKASETPIETINQNENRVSVVCDVNFNRSLNCHVLDIEFIRIEKLDENEKPTNSFVVIPSDFIEQLLKVDKKELSAFVYQKFEAEQMGPVDEEADSVI